MKKCLFAPVVALCFFCVSCNNGPSPATKKNTEAMHAIQNSFDTKDFSKLGDYIAENAVDHAGEKGDLNGLAAMKTEFEKWTSTMENSKTETIKEFVDDEWGMTWNHYSGTTKIEQMGYKPGDKMDMKAIEVAKFKDGKLIEHWSFMTPQDMMKMMPPPPPPSTPEPAAIDSTKKM